MKDLIVQRVIYLLLPFLQIYGCYVLLNGHHSPGGGFAGGAILGTNLILFMMITDITLEKNELFQTVLLALKSFGVLLYISLGMLGLVLKNNFLDNISALRVNLLLEVSIGLVVTGVMASFFCQLAGDN